MKMEKKKLLSVAVLILFLVFLLLFSTKRDKNEEVYKKTDILMGTYFYGTVYGGMENYLPALVKELERLEYEELSWREAESELGRLNAPAGQGTYQKVSQTLSGYLKDTLDIAGKSEGALDPTVGKIARLWDFGGENERLPEKEEINAALSTVGYEQIQQKGDEVFLPVGVSLDLGAVGKGIAADRAAEFLKEQKDVEGAVIAIGGSIALIGSKPDGSSFQLAITDPRGEEGEMLGILSLSKECFVSTSGDYQKYFVVKDKRYHHILNPKTGYPSESGLISVTVVCDSGLKSDGLSTACFVLGIEKGMELLKEYDAEGIFVDENKQVYITDGLETIFTLKAENYKIIK